MSIYLSHHRTFCENLFVLHNLEVSWDGNGGLPLRRKALQAATEIFGRRPDLAIGSRVDLSRGGLRVGLFRDGRDLTILIYPLGQVRLARHLPRQRPDLELFEKVVCERVFAKLEQAAPSSGAIPLLDVSHPEDVFFTDPFEGFEVLRLEDNAEAGANRLLMGRRSHSPHVYAFQEISELPQDLIRDQPVTGQTRLLDLISAYQGAHDMDESQTPEPA